MKKLFQWLAVSLLAAFALQAHAQRATVPIVDFVNVPVPATTQPVTAEQVRVAFVRAGAVMNWSLTPVSDGVMEATFIKENHTVVATVTYDAKGWSIAYKSSVNMKFDGGPNVTSPNGPRSAPAQSAWNAQQKLFVNDAFTPYAVVRTDGAMHPFYEHWVRRLMTAVNAQLKTA